MGAQTKPYQMKGGEHKETQSNDISPADHCSTQYRAACYSILGTAGHAMSYDLRPVRTAAHAHRSPHAGAALSPRS